MPQGTGGMNWMEMLIMMEQLRQQREANKTADKLANKKPGPIKFEQDPAGIPFNQQQLAWNNQQFDARQTMGRTMAEGFAPYMNDVLKGLGSPQNNTYMTPFGKTLAPLPSPMQGPDGKGGGFLDYLMKNPQWMDKPAGLPTGAPVAATAPRGIGSGGGGGAAGRGPRNRDVQDMGDMTGGWSQDYYDNPYNGGGGFGQDTPGSPGYRGPRTPPGAQDGVYQGPLGADNRPMFGSALSPEAAGQYKQWYDGLTVEQQEAEAAKAEKLNSFVTSLGSKVGGYVWTTIKENPLAFVAALAAAPLTGGMSVVTFLAERGINQVMGAGFDTVKNAISGIWSGDKSTPVTGSTPYTPPRVGPPAPGGTGGYPFPE